MYIVEEVTKSISCDLFTTQHREHSTKCCLLHHPTETLQGHLLFIHSFGTKLPWEAGKGISIESRLVITWTLEVSEVCLGIPSPLYSQDCSTMRGRKQSSTLHRVQNIPIIWLQGLRIAHQKSWRQRSHMHHLEWINSHLTWRLGIAIRSRGTLAMGQYSTAKD